MKSLLIVNCVNVCWETRTCNINSILGNSAAGPAQPRGLKILDDAFAESTALPSPAFPPWLWGCRELLCAGARSSPQDRSSSFRQDGTKLLSLSLCWPEQLPLEWHQCQEQVEPVPLCHSSSSIWMGMFSSSGSFSFISHFSQHLTCNCFK